MKSKIILGIVFVLMMMSLLAPATATVEPLGTFKDRICVELKQTCNNCTYNNISSVVYPNSTIALGNVVMTKSGTEYNHTFCSTSVMGTYIVNGYGDPNGVKTVWAYDFNITPSGFLDTLGFYFLILILSLGIIVLGFWREDAPITIFGTFGLYFVGLYVLFNGLAGIRDLTTTWAFALIVLGTAVYISIRSAHSLIVD